MSIYRMRRRFHAAYACLRGWPVLAHWQLEDPITINDPRATVIENVSSG